jgi:DNA-binding transcriptional MerR regulator
LACRATSQASRKVQQVVKTGQRYSVGEVAQLSGVTVRTLHHYGEIGLLIPQERTGAGYRQYTATDLDRLARILYYRDLGFALESIATLLDESTDTSEHLRRQHRLLIDRLTRVQAMVTAIEREMEAEMSGTELTAEEKLEIFGDSYDPAYEKEAEDRWGDTAAWKQSRQRTKNFTKDDWQRIKDGTDAFNAKLVAVFGSGALPGSPAANEIAEEHLAALNNFYDCGYDMQRNLADMYLADERFTKNYEDLAAGLTQRKRDAIHANADRAGGK